MPDKTIVMSDLHVSNGAAYSWCIPQTLKQICDMLQRVATDNDVGELVFLGDLIDMWLYPLDVVPLTASGIWALDANRDFVRAIRRCVENKEVYYLPGNHDMGVTEAELMPLSSGGKSIHLIHMEDYRKLHPERHLEHGHAVDMFNAVPTASEDTIGGLPLGFFITRLVATSHDHENSRRALHDVLSAHALKLRAAEFDDRDMLGQLLVTVIVDALSLKAKVNDAARIRFSDPDLDGRNIVVGDIKRHYGDLLSTWHAKLHDTEAVIESMLTAVRDDGLDWYAKELEKSPHPPKLIVFGHTHHSETESPYLNDGCWCRQQGQSYVEITPGSASVIPWASVSTTADEH